MLNLFVGNLKKKIVEKEEYGYVIGFLLDLWFLFLVMSIICVILDVDSLMMCVYW